MEETIADTQRRWSYALLKNGACVSPTTVRSSLVLGRDEGVPLRVQGLSVSLFVRGEPVNLAPYLVTVSLNIAGTISVREYEGEIAGNRFGIYCVDADTDIDLIDRDGTARRGICALNASRELGEVV